MTLERGCSTYNDNCNGITVTTRSGQVTPDVAKNDGNSVGCGRSPVVGVLLVLNANVGVPGVFHGYEHRTDETSSNTKNAVESCVPTCGNHRCRVRIRNFDGIDAVVSSGLARAGRLEQIRRTQRYRQRQVFSSCGEAGDVIRSLWTT